MEKSIIIKKTSISLSELFINNIEVLHKDGILDSIESIETININKINENKIEINRKVKAKKLLPDFINKLIPTNNTDKIYCYKENAILEYNTENYHIYSFTHISELSYYNIEGKIEFNYINDNINIKIFIKCIINNNNIPLKKVLEHKITDIVIQSYIRLFKKIENKYSI